MSARGDVPDEGAKIRYTIKITNNDIGPARNLEVWDTLENELKFVSNAYTPVVPEVNGQVIKWVFPESFVLEPGMSIEIPFYAEMLVTGDGIIGNRAAADYNDPFWLDWYGRHPPVESEICYYPDGIPFVYPNPFNKAIAINGTLKFGNIMPGSWLYVTTLSGEIVASVDMGENIRYEWDCMNRFDSEISPGIYFYVIKNKYSYMTFTGKIFVVKD